MQDDNISTMEAALAAARRAAPWEPGTYALAQNLHAARLAAHVATRTGPVWLLGNGPSLTHTAEYIRATGIPRIGTNKSFALVASDYHVLCHAEHLSDAVPGYMNAEQVAAYFSDLDHQSRLFMHGSSSDRGIAIPISHHAIFSTDLALGATEGTPATGGSVMLVAMQLAYHLGFRTFLMAGCECSGAKFYPGGVFHSGAQMKMVELWKLVAPVLPPDLKCYLIGDEKTQQSANNRAWPWIVPDDIRRVLYDAHDTQVVTAPEIDRRNNHESEV